MREKAKEITVTDTSNILDLLCTNLKDLTKKKIKSFLRYGMVYVNEKEVKLPNYELKTGDKVKIYFSKRNVLNFDINIIYEDKDIIVVDKPTNLLTISNDNEKEITLFRLVSEHIKKENKKNRLFVVHRLDKDTSGVLLFSKNLKLKEEMQKKWNDIVLLREYKAIVHGKIPKEIHTQSYLAMNHFKKMYSTNNKENGKLAISHFYNIKTKNGLSLVKAVIDTGRRNQIRVHLSDKGYPIVGDKVYGKNADLDKKSRLMLHANKLELIDPRTNEKLTFESKLPNEFNKLLK